MFEGLKKKARELKAWAEEHPFFAVATFAVGTVITGGIIYLVYRNMNGDEVVVAQPDIQPRGYTGGVKVPTITSFQAPEQVTDDKPVSRPTSEPASVMPHEQDNNTAYRLITRREHLRNITPNSPSPSKIEEMRQNGIEPPEHYTLVRASTPHIRCSLDDPRAVQPDSGEDGIEESSPLDLYDNEQIVVVLIENMETMDSEVFSKLYDRLDVDYQIEVDESIREFANNAVGCDYWDSDN